jgi:hypothetical protein
MAPFYPLIHAAESAVDLSYGDPATRDRYLAWLYPGDTPAHADEMGSQQYGCLLHARASLRACDLEGEVSYNGRTVDLLRCAYAPRIGQIGPMLLTLATVRGWLESNPDDLHDVRPADILIVGEGSQTHGLVVTAVDGATIYSVDGGQDDWGNLKPNGKPYGTAIRRCQRTIGTRAGRGVWLGDREIKWRIRL